MFSTRKARSIQALALAAWVAACGDSQEVPGDPVPESCEQLATLLQAALEQAVREEGLAGSTASVRWKECEWSGAAGFARTQPEAAMKPGDRLRIGSITKSFIAIVALQLAGEGKLSLDEPLSRLLPTVPRADRITLRQALNHTSGAPDYLSNPDFLARIEEEPGKVWTPEELLQYAEPLPPTFEPGKGWGYSNTNYILAGRVIEEAGKAPLAQQLRARIHQPLGLQSIGLEGAEPLPALTVRGYYRDPRGSWEDLTDVAHPSAGWAAGALTSTAEDVTRLFVALFEGSLLTEGQRAEMTQWVNTQVAGAPGYGLGLIQSNTALGPGVGHNGSVPGFSSEAAYFPEQRTAVTVLTNSEGANVPGVTRRLLKVMGTP